MARSNSFCPSGRTLAFLFDQLLSVTYHLTFARVCTALPLEQRTRPGPFSPISGPNRGLRSPSHGMPPFPQETGGWRLDTTSMETERAAFEAWELLSRMYVIHRRQKIHIGLWSGFAGQNWGDPTRRIPASCRPRNPLVYIAPDGPRSRRYGSASPWNRGPPPAGTGGPVISLPPNVDERPKNGKRKALASGVGRNLPIHLQGLLGASTHEIRPLASRGISFHPG